MIFFYTFRFSLYFRASRLQLRRRIYLNSADYLGLIRFDNCSHLHTVALLLPTVFVPKFWIKKNNHLNMFPIRVKARIEYTSFLYVKQTLNIIPSHILKNLLNSFVSETSRNIEMLHSLSTIEENNNLQEFRMRIIHIKTIPDCRIIHLMGTNFLLTLSILCNIWAGVSTFSNDSRIF